MMHGSQIAQEEGTFDADPQTDRLTACWTAPAGYARRLRRFELHNSRCDFHPGGDQHHRPQSDTGRDRAHPNGGRGRRLDNDSHVRPGPNPLPLQLGYGDDERLHGIVRLDLAAAALFTGSGSPTASSSLPHALSVQHTANGQQVEYDKHLLYTYSADTAPGQTKGQGLIGK
jgi:Secreted repeat of unknown function